MAAMGGRSGGGMTPALMRTRPIKEPPRNPCGKMKGTEPHDEPRRAP
jgi:hypothetical protein